MKIIVEVDDRKADFVKELLNNLKGVKATSQKTSASRKGMHAKNPKERLKADIKEAVRNINLVKQGKLKSKPLKQLLDEIPG